MIVKARLLAVVSLVSVVGMALQASAAPISLVVMNAGFEDPVIISDTYYGAVPLWSLGSAPVGISNPDNSIYTGTTGAAAPIPGDGDGFQLGFAYDGGYIYQDLDATLNPGGLNLLQVGEYSLTVAVGNRLDIGPSGTFGGSMGSYIIRLMAGTTVLATATALAEPLTDGSFTDIPLTYTATLADPIGTPVRVQLESTGTGINSHANYDNVRLSLLIPEPTSGSLLALGGLLIWRRRKDATGATALSPSHQ